ncbi:uncharacterized protein LOC128262404 isoform X1 [Drosophila gunungcola]|uniref:Uncharacterized protein n=2 Tax=Drosophila gunungcola TaxID=103775 RepID=A0A9P9YXA2_9MUSC|nr:uncharacterized protein LOC128262404 isoform X1 [Drosophila gunungcola]KAI8044548.1 hypothetical protein M5D96_000717 [Drosophila gunungcola]
MSATTILKLNHYCLYETFRQIKANCELNRRSPEKYWDLINFFISCERFVNVFKEWNYDLYKELHIDFAFLQAKNMVTIDLARVYESLKSVSKASKELYWKLYVNAVKENKQMNGMSITFKPSRYNPEHLDRFEVLINAIKNKISLQTLFIDVPGYSLQNVPPLGLLRIIYLNVRMNAEDLVQLVRANRFLNSLTFANTELYGSFADIVPYCKHLEVLDLTMKPGIDATKYAPQANLPLLEILRLRGYHQSGTLVKLFQNLKGRGIQRLDIPDILLSKQEAQAMLQLNTLSHILNGFSDKQIVADMTHLKNLKFVYLYARRGQLVLLVELMGLA